MRILVTIPHFYRAKANADFGSERADATKRLRALTACLLSLHQTFGPEQAHTANPRQRCNGAIAAAALDVVVCTTGGAHLAAQLPADLFRHHATEASPRLLGYECHAVLAENLGRYDYYGFLEDDLLITDPLFFWKLAWFTQAAGEEAVLQPNRFELSRRAPVRKLYIDSRLSDPTISPRFQDRSVRPVLKARVLGREVVLERPENPHSGCFFLTDAQMRRWSGEAYFLDRAEDFWGPLESAATLGLMRTFHLYKPAAANAGFLEIRHLDNRYLERRLRLPAGLQLLVYS